MNHCSPSGLTVLCKTVKTSKCAQAVSGLKSLCRLNFWLSLPFYPFSGLRGIFFTSRRCSNIKQHRHMFMFLVWISENLIIWKRPERSLSLFPSNHLIYHLQPWSMFLRQASASLSQSQTHSVPINNALKVISPSKYIKCVQENKDKHQA